MTSFNQRLEQLGLWAATGFEDDPPPLDEAHQAELKADEEAYEQSRQKEAGTPQERREQWKAEYRYWKQRREKTEILENAWQDQVRAVGPERVQALTAQLFREASSLPEGRSVHVIERLRREFLDAFDFPEKRKLLTEMLSPEAPVPDDWWMHKRSYSYMELDLTLGTPAARRMMDVLLAKAWNEAPKLRDRKILILLAADPHAWTLVCKQASPTDAEGREHAALPSQKIGWWAEAIRQHGADPEHGARKAAHLYKETRHAFKMTLLGDEGGVSRLIKLADGNLTAGFPVHEADYRNLPSVGDHAHIRQLPTPLRLADLALCFGNGNDVEALAKGGVDWNSFTIELGTTGRLHQRARHDGKHVSPVEAAFAVENPHTLDIWETLAKFGANPQDEHTSRRILMEAAAWKGGRPRRLLDDQGMLLGVIPSNEAAAQAHVTRLVEAHMPTTPTLWRKTKTETTSIFLTALHAGNLSLAHRALDITHGVVGKERTSTGNGFHALMALPATPDAQRCFQRLMDLGVSHTYTGIQGESAADVLARQPAERRAAWLTAAEKMGATWLAQTFPAIRIVKESPDRLVVPAFNASALERRRRTEELAERAAARRADPDGDIWASELESTPRIARRRSPRV